MKWCILTKILIIHQPGSTEFDDECVMVGKISLELTYCAVLGKHQPRDLRSYLAIYYFLEFLRAFYLSRMPLKSRRVYGSSTGSGYVSNTFPHNLVLRVLFPGFRGRLFSSGFLGLSYPAVSLEWIAYFLSSRLYLSTL